MIINRIIISKKQNKTPLLGHVNCKRLMSGPIIFLKVFCLMLSLKLLRHFPQSIHCMRWHLCGFPVSSTCTTVSCDDNFSPVVITPKTHDAGPLDCSAWVPCCLLEMTFSQRFCVSDLIVTQTGSYGFQDVCSTDGERLRSEVQSGCLRAEDTLPASHSADSHSLISRNIPLAISCRHHNFLHNISKSLFDCGLGAGSGVSTWSQRPTSPSVTFKGFSN